MATLCCWPPESWPGYLRACSGILTLRQHLHGQVLGFLLGQFAHLAWGERDIVENREMGKEVELLEDHSCLPTHLLDVAHVVRQVDAVDCHPSAVVLLEAVDAPDEGGFATARRPDDHHHFLAANPHVDPLQRLEFAEELVHTFELDDRLARGPGRIRVVGLRGHRSPTPNLLSSRRDSRDMV